MWVIVGVIALSILLEPKCEVSIANVLIEVIAFVSAFVPMLCLRYLSEFCSLYEIAFTNRLFFIPIVGVLLIFVVDFCTAWIVIVDKFIIKIKNKQKRQN